MPEGGHGKEGSHLASIRGRTRWRGYKSRFLAGLGNGEGDRVPTSSCPSAAPSTLLTGLRGRVVVMNCGVLKWHSFSSMAAKIGL